MNRIADAIDAFNLYGVEPQKQNYKIKTVSKIRNSHSDILINFLGRSCKHCKTKNKSLQVDHIIPLCMAGADDIHNLQVLCWRCHGIKSRYDRQIAVVGRKNSIRDSSSGYWVWLKPKHIIRDFYKLCYSEGIFTIREYDAYKVYNERNDKK